MKTIIKILFLVCCLTNGVNAQTVGDTIYFDVDKYNLNAEAKEKLEHAVSKIDIAKLKKVTLYGNTDSDGDSKYNVALSKMRANTVADYLISKGFPAAKISQVFNGEDKPIQDEKFPSAKKLNRSVVLVFESEAKEIVNDIFSKLQTESQFFEVKSREEIVVTGKEGTIIKIPKNSLIKKDGSYAVGVIKIELKEFYKKSDMIRADLHSMSDERLLESGGMLYIAATNNGEPLQLKKNAEMTVEMASRNNMSDMKTFYGEHHDNKLNWKQREISVQKNKTKDEPLIVESFDETQDTIIQGIEAPMKVSKAFYKINRIDRTILRASKLGWINCDRFNTEQNKTNVFVKVDGRYRPEIRLVFKDIKSIMRGRFDVFNRELVFENVPAGMKATIIAFSCVGDETFFTTKDITIEKDLRVGLELQKTTLEDLENHLIQLN